jgi:hypothetical protein
MFEQYLHVYAIYTVRITCCRLMQFLNADLMQFFNTYCMQIQFYAHYMLVCAEHLQSPKHVWTYYEEFLSILFLHFYAGFMQVQAYWGYETLKIICILCTWQPVLPSNRIRWGWVSKGFTVLGVTDCCNLLDVLCYLQEDYSGSGQFSEHLQSSKMSKTNHPINHRIMTQISFFFGNVHRSQDDVLNKTLQWQNKEIQVFVEIRIDFFIA